MDIYGWLQLVAYVGILLLLTKPMGIYLVRVLDSDSRTFLDPVLKPVESLFYRMFRLEQSREQDWMQYTISLLIFSLTGFLFTYIILRIQHLLPLNPQGFGPLCLLTNGTVIESHKVTRIVSHTPYPGCCRIVHDVM